MALVAVEQGSQSEKLEREVGETRRQLADTLDELRARLTPERVIDQLIDHAREGPVAEFLRNLGWEVRENPLPLVLIGIGIAWLMIASNRSSRATLRNALDAIARRTADQGEASNTVVGLAGDATGGLAEKPSALSVDGSTVEEAKWPMADPRNVALAGVDEPDLAIGCEEQSGKVTHLEKVRANAAAREPR